MSHYSLNQNQLNQTPLLAQVARIPNVDTETCQINPNTTAAAGTILAGCAVKLVANTGPEVVVDVMADPTDGPCFGVIVYNPQKNSYVAGDRVEVATDQNVIFLLTSAAVTRGARVAVTNPTSSANDPTVATDNTAGHYTLGNALQQASGAGQIIAVRVKPGVQLVPSTTNTCTTFVSP